MSKKLKEPPIVLLTEPEEVQEIVQATLESKPSAIGLDTETTGIHLRNDRIAIISWYAPTQIRVPQLGDQYVAAAYVVLGPTTGVLGTLEALRPLLESDIPKVGSNISGFDWFMFKNHGITLGEPLYDTLFLSWLYDENRMEHGLKQAMYDFYGYTMRSIEEASRTSKKELTDYWKWDFDRLRAYSGIDGWASYQVFKFLHSKLRRKRLLTGQTLWDVYEEHIYPLQAIIRELNGTGIRVDKEQLKHLEAKLKKARDEAGARLQEIAYRVALQHGRTWDGVVNPRSTQQLRRLFFSLLRAPVIKMGKPHSRTGVQHPSLDRSVLQEYAEQGDTVVAKAAQAVLDYRALDKLIGTYVGDEAKKTGLLYKLEDGRIYPTFKLRTVTGRFACQNPNLQNIPSRGPLAKDIRRAFVATEGYKLVVADYSQLELCLLAHFSEQKQQEDQRVMCNALLHGEDLHCRTASIMYGVPYDTIFEAKRKSDAEEEVTPEEKQLLKFRTAAKTISYGLVYGMGTETLAKQLKVSVQEASEYVERYFSAYPSARQWIENVLRTASARGEVWTLLGRPRRLREIHSPDEEVRARARRQAVNSIIQGSAADIMYIAMKRVFSDERLRSWGMRMLLQVHDEIVIEVREEHAEEARQRLSELMHVGRDDGLAVELTVSAHVGDSWADAK